MELVKDALSENEKFFWYVLDTTDDAALVTDDDGFLSYISPNTAGLFGLPVEEIWQMEHISVLLGEGLFDSAELKSAGAINHIEYRLQTPLGATRNLLINVRAVALRQGAILYCCRDITPLKASEEELRDAVRMKSEFIAMAGHELRTPLTAIQCFAELLLRQPDIDAESLQRALATIYEQAQELSKITDDLLDLSRTRSKDLHLRKHVVDARSLVERVIQKARQKTPRHRLKEQFPESPIGLLVDETRIERVLENLLDNALKYSPPHGWITLGARQSGDDFLFWIEDEGIGLTPEQRHKVFDLFHRVDGSDTATPGLGLGLSVARAIVEAHGGRIWLESTINQGTKVSFTVPMIGGQPSHG